MKLLVSILVLLLIAPVTSVFCQDNSISLTIVHADGSMLHKNKTNDKREGFKDSVAVASELQKILLEYFREGYLEAVFDSVQVKDSLSMMAYCSKGNRYKSGQIEFRDIDASVLRKAGINSGNFKGTNFDYHQLVDAQEKLINYYENNGYPFVAVGLDSIDIENDTFSAQCYVKKNSLYTIDSIIVKGTANISAYYLNKYLGVIPNMVYREEKIVNIHQGIQELNFVREIRKHELLFDNEKVDIYLYLDDKKASQFNGVLGILPNNTTTGKLLLTGDVMLYLLNSFGRGELISIDWQKLETATQRLGIELSYPYLFHTSLGLLGEFDLFKKDTLYYSMHTSAGLQYFMQGGNYVKAYIDYKGSSVLSTDGLENLTVLPDYADVSAVLYGIGYYHSSLDYKFNPTKGYSLLCAIGAGTKQVKKNAHIPELAYNDIQLRSTQIEATVSASLFIPTGRKMTIMLRNMSAHLNNSSLFENELFRLGGMKSLRGFDEESITASSYSIMSLEYRYLFEKNSNVYLFADLAWYEKDLPDKYVRDIPFGFGLGFNLETKAGIFSISYAIGKQFDNPIEVRSAKIHFGYINRF